MSFLIPSDYISEVRERTDIETLVGEYVSLKRAGKSLRGLCPFHSEKTPSFHVHPGRGFFYCFGCRASGDSIAFVMRMQDCSFLEALRQLAERAGVRLPEPSTDDGQAAKRERIRRERLRSIVASAAEFFVRQYSEHPGAVVAKDELTKRRIDAGAVQSFGLGYAPDAWDTLGQWLRAQGVSMAEAELVGLVVARTGQAGRYYDRFRHRLMFPIVDAHGHVVAFSGRLLERSGPSEAHSEPKYINSPDTPLYSKGELLFGLHQGRVEARRRGWIALCEGNFDVLALHQVGYPNAAAPLGTALTDAQCKLLRRAADRVTLLFDADGAGHKAVRPAYEALQRAGIETRVAQLPPGEDPDSLIRSRGAQHLTRLIDGAANAMDYLIEQAAAEADTPAAKARAIAGLAPMLAAVHSPVERRLYVERVARRFGVTDLQAVKAQLRTGLHGKAGRSGHSEANFIRLKQNSTESDVPELERDLIGVLIDQPSLFTTHDAKRLGELLTHPSLQAIFRAAASMVGLRGAIECGPLLDGLQDEPVRTWLEGRFSIEKYDQNAAVDALRNGTALLEKQRVERALPLLARQIDDAWHRGDEAQAIVLTRQHDQLAQSAHLAVQSTKR